MLEAEEKTARELALLYKQKGSAVPRKINVALIGYQFMGKAHSNAYRQMPHFFDSDAVPVMKVICGRNEGAVKAAAAKYGWEE